MNILIKKHLESRGEKYIGDESMMGELIVPFLLLDASNIIRTTYLGELPLKHNAKKCYNNWVNAYNSFNKSFFAPFTDDEKLEVIELMDDFSSYIHNDLEKLRICLLGKFKDYSDGLRVELAAILCSNILSQAAQYVYTHFRRKGSDHIVKCEKWSFEFLNAWSAREVLVKTKVDLAKFNDLHDLVGALCRRVQSFTKEKTFL